MFATDNIPLHFMVTSEGARETPVINKTQVNPSNKRLVYALLDDQSDTTFITDTTLNHLGVSGPETNLLLSTMHATDELIKSRKIEGLMVQEFQVPSHPAAT